MTIGSYKACFPSWLPSDLGVQRPLTTRAATTAVELVLKAVWLSLVYNNLVVCFKVLFYISRVLYILMQYNKVSEQEKELALVQVLNIAI